VIPVNEVDRKQNIVVSVVSEDCDPSIWCQEVEAILGYVHGQRVEVVDMFRLGRFYPGKNRPVYFLLSGSLYDNSNNNVFALHSTDNTSR